MLNWGVLGLGNISGRFIKSLENSEGGKLYAVSSYTKEKRERFLKDYPNIKIYENYTDLLEDKDVDVIYIALRHQDHYQWAKQALLNNKAVLCEKPATLSYTQTKELCDIAKNKNIFFMEAMKSRFIPLVNELKKMIDDGVIGDILRIETAFCNDVPYNEKSYLFDKDQGGALYDVSIYNIATVLDFMKSKVKNIDVKWQNKYGVDVYEYVEVTFESNQTAVIECAIDRNKDKVMTIYGTKGKIIANPFYRPTKATLLLNDDKTFTREIPYIYDDFYGEIEATQQGVVSNKFESERMSHQDSLVCIELIEKIKEIINKDNYL